MNIVLWLKNNKLAVVLILVVAYFLIKDKWWLRPVTKRTSQPSVSYDVGETMITPEAGGLIAQKSLPAPPSESAPQPNIKDRLVVEESNVSLVAEDIRQQVDKIINHVTDKGGYMVSSSISQPQEAPFATVVVRLPKKELRPTLEYLRKLAIKVTSENLRGWDVTDQYVDLEARLETLNKTKAKFEEILGKAVNINDILYVQRELVNLQKQIDSLKGQQQYLEKTAENAKLTIYLAEDEWSLPYAPEEPTFRPKVIFKQAIRSLVQTLRGLAKFGIWLGVFSVIWAPLIIIFWALKKHRKS